MSDLIDRGQRQTDLRPYLGKNILPIGGETEEQDPFCGEIPNDAKGYREYRNFYEQKLNSTFGGGKFIGMEFDCEVLGRGKTTKYFDDYGKKKPGHQGVDAVFACFHVLPQDLQEPEGITCKTDGGIVMYLCPTCAKLLDKGKLDLMRDLSLKCSKCVLEMLTQIQARKPGRLIGLMWQ